MFLRWLSGFLLTAALVCAQKIPLATFSGTVHSVSSKQLTIETAEGNLVDFDINRKTQLMRGKQRISPEDLQNGDFVTIEARQEMVRFLVAVTVTVRERTKD
jgi:hypothetical protein